MKIKQVEELVGITSKNIRFYEEQGLLTPERAENGYREYHEENIKTLKKIKLLRKLGVPVEEIKSVLSKSISLEECLENQMRHLEKERENLNNMQKLSNVILQKKDTVDTINTDEWLDEMEKNGKGRSRFCGRKQNRYSHEEKNGSHDRRSGNDYSHVVYDWSFSVGQQPGSITNWNSNIIYWNPSRRNHLYHRSIEKQTKGNRRRRRR